MNEGRSVLWQFRLSMLDDLEAECALPELSHPGSYLAYWYDLMWLPLIAEWGEERAAWRAGARAM